MGCSEHMMWLACNTKDFCQRKHLHCLPTCDESNNKQQYSFISLAMLFSFCKNSQSLGMASFCFIAGWNPDTRYRKAAMSFQIHKSPPKYASLFPASYSQMSQAITSEVFCIVLFFYFISIHFCVVLEKTDGELITNNHNILQDSGNPYRSSVTLLITAHDLVVIMLWWRIYFF